MGVCPSSDTGTVANTPSNKRERERYSCSTSPPSNSVPPPADVPFTDYNNIHVQVLAPDDGESSTPLLRTRSKSIDVLKRIARSRSVTVPPTLEEDLRRLPSASVGASSDLEKASSPPTRRRSVGGYTHRLSGVLNGLQLQLGNVCPRKEDEAWCDYLHRVFTSLDTDGDGWLDVDDVSGSLFRERRESVEAIMRSHGTDANTPVSLSEGEFVRMLSHISDSDCLFAEVDSVPEGECDVCSTDCEVESIGTRHSMASPVHSVIKQQKEKSVLYDVRIRNLAPQADRIRCVDLSDDGTLYAVAHQQDCQMNLYSTRSGCQTRCLRGHSAPLYNVCFASGKKFVATAGCDGLLALWDRIIGVDSQALQHPGVVLVVAFSVGGRVMYTGCQDNTVRRFSCSGPSCVTECCLTEDASKRGVVTALAAQNRHDDIIIAASSEGRLLVLSTAQLEPTVGLSGHAPLVLHASFSEDDETFVTACSRKVLVWNTATLACVASLDSFTAVEPVRLPSRRPLWTAVTRGKGRFRSLLFAFNSMGTLCIAEMKPPAEGEPEDAMMTAETIMTLEMRMPITAVSKVVDDSFICGDAVGNVFAVQLL